MFIVVESHIFPIVRIDAGSGNDGTPKVTADIFYDSASATEIWFGINLETVIREATLGKKTMDMRIPFERPVKSMQDADKTRDKDSAFIHFMEESENDTAYSLKKAVKESAVIQEEREEVFINGKNDVSVCGVNEFERNFSGAVNAVFIAAGGAKLGMAIFHLFYDKRN